MFHKELAIEKERECRAYLLRALRNSPFRLPVAFDEFDEVEFKVSFQLEGMVIRLRMLRRNQRSL